MTIVYAIAGLAAFILALASIGRHSPKPPVIIKPVVMREITNHAPIILRNVITNVRWPINE